MFAEGAASDFGVFWWGKVNLTEFKNVKQVSKNTYSLFNFLNWLIANLLEVWTKDDHYMQSMWTKHCKAMIKAQTNIITLFSMDTTLLL